MEGPHGGDGNAGLEPAPMTIPALGITDVAKVMEKPQGQRPDPALQGYFPAGAEYRRPPRFSLSRHAGRQAPEARDRIMRISYDSEVDALISALN